MLGLGHGAFLREDVDGSGDQPILQGKETSLKVWKWSEGKENKKNKKKQKIKKKYKTNVNVLLQNKTQ